MWNDFDLNLYLLLTGFCFGKELSTSLTSLVINSSYNCHFNFTKKNVKCKTCKTVETFVTIETVETVETVEPIGTVKTVENVETVETA